MDFINNTQFPALNFEGIDQLDQRFHVVVMRQTYTWNDKGLLILAESQDPLCMVDQLVDPTDIMSGVIEESDLCHVKPKCDILIKGHAYTPKYRMSHYYYNARLQVQTPDKILYAPKQHTDKYEFVTKEIYQQQTKDRYLKGNSLIDKTLTILSPRYVTQLGKSVTGHLRYELKQDPMDTSTSLNPNNSFGGYCFIEENDPAIKLMNEKTLIPQKQRADIRLNKQHGLIAYFAQDAHNPAGKGAYPNEYLHATQPNKIELPRIHTPNCVIEAKHIEQLANSQLDPILHKQLVDGFGIRAKTHPDRLAYAGTLDQKYIDSGKQLPEDFDFLVWNSAYPDQQVAEIKGDEWITLTNLCSIDTLAAQKNAKGDTILKLYLPENLAYLQMDSTIQQHSATEVPMKIDTIVISPDEHKVNIVWRSIIDARYKPNRVLMAVIDRQKKEEILAAHFTQLGEVVRPYEVGL